MHGVFKSEFYRRVEVVNGILHRLELLDGIIYESLPERNFPDKGFLDGFFVTTHEEIGMWRGGFGSHGFANKLEKIPVHEE